MLLVQMACRLNSLLPISFCRNGQLESRQNLKSIAPFSEATALHAAGIYHVRTHATYHAAGYGHVI